MSTPSSRASDRTSSGVRSFTMPPSSLPTPHSQAALYERHVSGERQDGRAEAGMGGKRSVPPFHQQTLRAGLIALHDGDDQRRVRPREAEPASTVLLRRASEQPGV